MRVLLTVIGVLLMLAGGTWFLQGIGVLPGSFMTGQREWAVYGATAFALGVARILFARRRARP